jgi:hypothetical protein
MNQLALFTEPPVDPDLAPGRLWLQSGLRDGDYRRAIKIKAIAGSSATVCPANFVDDKWPWYGRTISIEALRGAWQPMRRTAA